MDVRTQEIATIDTYLVARSTYSSGAYEELLRSLQARRHPASGRGNDHGSRGVGAAPVKVTGSMEPDFDGRSKQTLCEEETT